MECPYCKGKLYHQNASYSANRSGYHLIIDNVSAWVCEQCGEALFDEEAVDAIQEMLTLIDTKTERLPMLATTG